MKKKMIQSLLVASLAFGMAVSPVTPIAFAAETGTITVQDTQKGATYKAYKVFDAEIDNANVSDSNKDGASYLIPQGKEAEYKASTDFNSLFTTTTNGGRTYVTKKDTASANEIATWAKSISANTTPVSTVTESNNDGTEVINVSQYGYYYVSSTVNNGAVIMVTSVTPNATIHEKNTDATWGDGGGKTVDQKTYSVGDTVKYTITYKNAVNYHGTEKVYQYVIKDTMPSASVVDLNEGSYEVTITDGSGNITTLTQGSEKATGKYNLLEENNNFTITIPWAATNTPTGNTQNGANDDFFYKGINTITVTYTGVLKSGAKPGSADLPENTNIATINPNTSNDDPGQKVTVRDGQITIKKIDGSTKASLQGAIFVLKNATGQFLNFNDTNNVEWGTEANATEYTTGATITGLKEGTYYLVEKKAPLGYNLLDNSQKVILGDGATDTTNSDNLLVNPTVENNKGTELPSTGGIGTTIFYIIGAILVIGAGIVLVARRRLRS
ncbi:TPA: LPXTG cell wall anchor domain-containing protein [Streptococcus agalactiae]|nr:LPXTG cell wall anchor domain-containing protein [Streptococcus agalactiae]